MEKSRKVLKTITISEVWYPEDATVSSGPFFFVNVEVPSEDDSTEGSFTTLEEAEKYASDVAKRPLRPLDANSFIAGER